VLFHSPEFIVLMLLTLALYAAVPRARVPILAVANLAFYGASGWQYLLLFLTMSALTYWCSLGAGGPRARLLLWLGVAANLANLFIFKYTGFATANLDRLFHLGLDPKAWQLLLPVGISFYTFQLMAYLIDVHRGDIAPSRNLLEFWVFIAFFGQLIAGPIMRGADFLPQVEAAGQTQIRWGQFKRGVYLFTLGMAKKVFLSDMLSPRTDNFFASWSTLNGLEAWIAGWLFAFQIYYDFSAYSEMALGIGHMFGFDLSVNFRTPYLARNPEEFWKRWHITLSSFIRDYIYIPLGGSRKGESRAYVNMVAAMVLSGMWHGAAWTFVAWGLFHGLLSALHKLWHRHVLKRFAWKPAGIVTTWLSVFLMFQATTVGWIFFRGKGIDVALTLIQRMFTPEMLRLTPLATRYLPVIAVLYLLHVGEFWVRQKEEVLVDWWHRWFPAPLRALTYTAAGAILLLMTRLEETAFIYFRF
jgi:alginate O-acetyltransferase complex protein AlgI